MLKLFTLFKLENLKQVVGRFPLPVVLIVIVSLLFFLLNNWNLSYDSPTLEMLQKGITTLILMFFLSIWVSFSVEHTSLSPLKKSLFQLIPLVCGVLFYLRLDGGGFDASYSNGVFVMISFIWVLAYLFFAPYLTTCRIQNTLYYQYFYKLAQVFLFGFVLWGLLFGLGSLAILSLQLLFDIGYSLQSDLISNWAIISLSFITPLVCLMKLPRDTDQEEKDFTLHTFAVVIIKYVLTSFVFLYFVILYAYTVKVLASFSSWPRGEVCRLVIAFSSIGYLHYLLSSYLDPEVKAVRIFRKWFPIVVLPQIFMLFYAIALRIQQYDVTMARYFVVAFGIWLLVLSLYFIFSKRKSLLMLPAVLVVFTILVSFWPRSVFSLPEARQMARLEANLKEAGILVDGQIIPLQEGSEIDRELSGQIYDGIRYLCNNSDCKKVAQLFGKDAEEMSSRRLVDAIAQEIGVERYYSTDRGTPATFYVYGEDNVFPLDVTWYSVLVEIGTSTSAGKVEVDIEHGSVQVYGEWGLQETLFWDMKTPIYEALVAGDGDAMKRGNSLPKEALTFEIRGERYDVKLLFRSVEIRNPEYSWDAERYYFPYVSGYALIRRL